MSNGLALRVLTSPVIIGSPALMQLDELSARAAGDAPPPTPGLSEQVPLHVVIKGAKKLEAGPTRLLRAVVGRLLLFSLVGVAWVLAAAWIRKNVSLSVSQSAAGGAATAGNYAPKEYNKENLPEKVMSCLASERDLQRVLIIRQSPNCLGNRCKYVAHVGQHGGKSSSFVPC